MSSGISLIVRDCVFVCVFFASFEVHICILIFVCFLQQVYTQEQLGDVVRVHVLSLPARGQELQVAAEDVSAVEVRANS